MGRLFIYGCILFHFSGLVQADDSTKGLKRKLRCRGIKKYVILIICFFCTSALARQKPDWVENNGISAQYPEHLYVTGSGIGEDENLAERRSLADQHARSDLSSRFIIKVQSEILSVDKFESGEHDTEFRNTVSSQTQLNMVNWGLIS